MLVTGLVCCVTVATLLVAAILGASAYESVVVSYSWAARPEEAVGHYRALGAIVTPARFFRLLAPLSQVALLVALIVSIAASVALVWTGTALAAMVLADVITFTFHYPRNRALFIDPILPAPRLEAVAREWRRGNAMRVVLVAIAFLALLRALWVIARHVAP
jgi:hypothetical protein